MLLLRACWGSSQSDSRSMNSKAGCSASGCCGRYSECSSSYEYDGSVSKVVCGSESTEVNEQWLAR